LCFFTFDVVLLWRECACHNQLSVNGDVLAFYLSFWNKDYILFPYFVLIFFAKNAKCKMASSVPFSGHCVSTYWPSFPSIATLPQQKHDSMSQMSTTSNISVYFVWLLVFKRGRNFSKSFARSDIFCGESLLKGKAQYSWPPSIILFRSTAFHANIFFAKLSNLMRRSFVLSLHFSKRSLVFVFFFGQGNCIVAIELKH
jgi:hypothetical protein